YPSGVVKKTYLKGAANGPETITFEDVIQSTTLVTTVLSSFQWDYEWVLKQLPSRRDHKSLFIIHGKTEEERKAITEVLSFVPLLKLCFPKLEGQVNVMHSKLMLLFHKDGEKEWLRIVVPTGNLTDYDWGDMGGVMENMLFLIDLPKLPSINPEQTFFMQELLRFVGAQDVPENILNKIVGYDFSATEKMAFVHTIGGSILGEEARCTGYPGLATAVKELGYNSGKGLEIDFVTSSLGALKEDFLSALYRAAQGFDGIDAKIKKPATKGDKKSTMSTPEPELTSITPHEPETSFATISSSFRIYFPSSSTVSSSNGGPNCGGTICFQRSFWNAPTFPQGMIYDCKSVRPGTLMHNKLLLARPATKMKDEEACAWAYLGSANLSESAWGKLVMDRATKQPKLNCRNWECGVILPVPKSVLGRTLGGEDVKRPVGLEAFEKVVPVPMKTPAERVERPWFFTF
ncbi:tyrosyl-DNA phosphodiesterase I, partial [Pyronema domesticum]